MVKPQILVGVICTIKEQKLIVESYVNKILNLLSETDQEKVHCIADDLLLEVLCEIGFEEITEAYDIVSEIGFWYV